ncbi:MAG: VWA domain-containing protein, partial [Planctomycetales bacterium]|nr:VWA domain-containing protein [Planctomycetales bacterium]
MSNFRFANPDWSAALWCVLAVVGLLFYLEQRRGRALSTLVSTEMQPHLVTRLSLLRRYTVIVLLGLSGICFVIALMRPQFGLTYVKSPRVGAQVMFCLDVSKSMLAEDVVPNRLDRAKADITDLVSLLDGDQVGLIGFAGRAAVLCPLTPDYGFFNLILAGAGPSSVGRGGTRLEEPLRKALDGFRSESDVSRVVFLITDGEDHDSHPLEVAQDAIDRGINIVAVGLGDEAGSEIRITDPRTGVQSQVLDADGAPVITRLDGETLRDLALATDGVYIPAGTGSLDLKSIYDAHIKPLVRGEMQSEGRAIRRDAFQWVILLGLVFLFTSVVLGSSRGNGQNSGLFDAPQSVQPQRINAKPAAAILLCALTVGLSHTTNAEDSESSAPDGQNKTTALTSDPEEEVDPREIYNQGINRLQSDFDLAENLLTQARRESAGDGEVR